MRMLYSEEMQRSTLVCTLNGLQLLVRGALVRGPGARVAGLG